MHPGVPLPSVGRLGIPLLLAMAVMRTMRFILSFIHLRKGIPGFTVVYSTQGVHSAIVRCAHKPSYSRRRTHNPAIGDHQYSRRSLFLLGHSARQKQIHVGTPIILSSLGAAGADHLYELQSYQPTIRP